ncbi:MAG: Unknown protein [uncultured Sulfurovum sp.]|uniref:Uncharacterized protein n=1 Tax=uncultured Sulfurovum sp. TaxID=269237 RepID=A0A6S6TGY3_9BACT|nr:MAG: Unknown protein [uncultured Sulfurovum sp.]
MTWIANTIKFLSGIFININEPLSLGMALLSAGIGLIMFTTTTTILFGIITKEATPYLIPGYFLIGLASIFMCWGIFYP